MAAGELRILTPRLVLRSYRDGDVGDLVAAADDPRVAAHLRDAFPSPYTEDDAREWIAIAGSGDPLHGMAITIADRVVGGIGLLPQDDIYRLSAELGYWLGVDHWGRGLMTEAVIGFCDHVFGATELHRLFARVVDGNPASERVLVRAGFVREGVARQAAFKAGRFLDVAWYGRLRAGPPSPSGA
jgi:RimJ/RimL family protein N-acetyltransferase